MHDPIWGRSNFSIATNNVCGVVGLLCLFVEMQDVLDCA